jgi:hypothetical protein
MKIENVNCQASSLICPICEPSPVFELISIFSMSHIILMLYLQISDDGNTTFSYVIIDKQT